jgi:DNA-binding FrmR family transcriptional regulator
MAQARGYTASKDQLKDRLARIEGQVRGIARMVEEDRYCIDVLTQINAIQAALDRVALGLLDDHARHCLVGGVAAGDRTLDAVLDMVLEDLVLHAPERRPHRPDLGEDVDAVAVLLDHPRDPAHLPLDPPEPVAHAPLRLVAHP